MGSSGINTLTQVFIIIVQTVFPYAAKIQRKVMAELGLLLNNSANYCLSTFCELDTWLFTLFNSADVIKALWC